MLRPPPRLTLFPYTTLFRSVRKRQNCDPRRRRPLPVSRPFGRRWRAGWSDSAHGTSYLYTAHLKGHNTHCAESDQRSEEHTSELQSRRDLVCRLLLEKKNKT